jgi:hypothetical protein
MRHLLGFKNMGKTGMQVVIDSANNNNNNNCFDTVNIFVVSLDAKYVGVVIGKTNDKIVAISQECEAHYRFEIPKCMLIVIERRIITTSINKEVI